MFLQNLHKYTYWSLFSSICPNIFKLCQIDLDVRIRSTSLWSFLIFEILGALLHEIIVLDIFASCCFSALTNIILVFACFPIKSFLADKLWVVTFWIRELYVDNILTKPVNPIRKFCVPQKSCFQLKVQGQIFSHSITLIKVVIEYCELASKPNPPEKYAVHPMKCHDDCPNYATILKNHK